MAIFTEPTCGEPPGISWFDDEELSTRSARAGRQTGGETESPMPFVCPQCSVKSLKVASKIELPSDSRSDEITLQIVLCSRCGFAGLAVYEESRRGALGSESFDHTGYRVSVDDLRRVKRAIERCPKPRDRRCKCSAHCELGSKDASGRWNGLKDVQRDGAFKLKL